MAGLKAALSGLSYETQRILDTSSARDALVFRTDSAYKIEHLAKHKVVGCFGTGAEYFKDDVLLS